MHFLAFARLVSLGPHFTFWDWNIRLTVCKGVNIRVPNIYKMSPELLAMVSASSQGDLEISSANPASQVHVNGNGNTDPFTSTMSRADSAPTTGSSVLWEKFDGSNVSVASVGAPHESLEIPGRQSSESDDLHLANGSSGTEGAWEPPLAPLRKNRSLQTTGVDCSGDSPPKMKPPAGIKARSRSKLEHEEQNAYHADKEGTTIPRAGERKRNVSGQVAHPPPPAPSEPGAPQRRSVRLFNQIRPTTSKLSNTALGAKDGRELKKVRATGTKGRTATTSNVGRVVSGNRKHLTESQDGDNKPASSLSHAVHHAPSKNTAVDRSKDIEALNWLLELFCKLATGFFALSRYQCSDAIQVFESLSPGQRETPWVLSQIGKAYYEQAMYSEAEKYFFRVKTLAPSQLEDMEIYSTVLWHLKNDVEIAYLAHELMEIDRLSPQAWCAIGNSFSIQRDHDQALKCFRRATQLDPKFAYGFTLQGHEYVANEEYDKALDAYRSGINADNRHYNAWYGLGTVYDRMGKLEFAEQHFRNAAGINPTNSVLICCIGLLLEKMNNPTAALAQYGRACSLAPHSVLARFRKARALMKLRELRLALTELRTLKDMAPDEANVHYLLGRLYKMLLDKPNAIKHFTTALNLDPKVRYFFFFYAPDHPSASGPI